MAPLLLSRAPRRLRREQTPLPPAAPANSRRSCPLAQPPRAGGTAPVGFAALAEWLPNAAQPQPAGSPVSDPAETARLTHAQIARERVAAQSGQWPKPPGR